MIHGPRAHRLFWSQPGPDRDGRRAGENEGDLIIYLPYLGRGVGFRVLEYN